MGDGVEERGRLAVCHVEIVALEDGCGAPIGRQP